MPVHGIFSCVRPAFYTHGPGSYPTFPACVSYLTLLSLLAVR